jgi:GNAT superfamily N-acetyltransferase
MITTQSGIREATADDLEVMVVMGLRFARESGYSKLPITESSIRTLIAWVLANGVVLLALKDEHPVGMVGVVVLPHMLTARPYGAEVAWWCNPEARGHGLRLLRAAERWAKDHGAATMQFVAPTEDVERIYQRLGYVKLETAYEKELLCRPE